MPAEKLYSAAEAAKLLGREDPGSNLSRVARRINVGQKIGRTWVFTAAEVKKIGAAWKDGPGSPLFVEGNTLGAEAIAKRWAMAKAKKKTTKRKKKAE